MWFLHLLQRALYYDQILVILFEVLLLRDRKFAVRILEPISGHNFTCPYCYRLAISFEKRLKQDQRRVENTVGSNTPSDVEKDFSNFSMERGLTLVTTSSSCWANISSHSLSSGEIEDNVYYPRLACLIFEVIIIHVAVNNLRSNLT